MANAALDKALAAICPVPMVEKVDDLELKFWPLDLSDHVKIKKRTGADLTREMLRGFKDDALGSELVLEVFFASLTKVSAENLKGITREQVAQIIAFGLGGFSNERVANILSYAISGQQPSKEGDSGKATSPESTGD